MAKTEINGKLYTKRQLKRMARNILNDAMASTKSDTIDWINKYVPKRTGQLRESLIAWINKKWKVSDSGLVISMGSKIPYALNIKGDPVHTGTWLEHSGKPATDYKGNPIWLDDPTADPNWVFSIADFIKDSVVKYINSYKSIYLG
jgi:hypothetical protein